MPKFLCADLHLGHKRMVEFDELRQRNLRPFSNVDEHDSALIKGINDTCNSGDTLYVLGDVVINSKYLHLLRQVNCDMQLIMGNHEIEDVQMYLKYFSRISSCRVFEKFIATHIPVHPNQIPRFNVNVHGHLHDKVVRYDDGNPNTHYICVSMEQINYTPISLDAIEQRIVSTVRGKVKGDTSSHP